MKETTQEKRHSINLPAFRVKASALIDYVEKIADSNEEIDLTLTEDDGRTEVTLEGIQEIRENILRLDTPFTVTIGKLELSAGDTFGTCIRYYDRDEKRANRIKSFLYEETPWHVFFAHRFFQKKASLKMAVSVLVIFLLQYWFKKNLYILIGLTIAFACFIAYGLILNYGARPKIIHRESGSWLERNKDQLVVYSIVAVIGATLSNLDRLFEFIQGFANQ